MACYKLMTRKILTLKFKRISDYYILNKTSIVKSKIYLNKSFQITWDYDCDQLLSHTTYYYIFFLFVESPGNNCFKLLSAIWGFFIVFILITSHFKNTEMENELK